MPHADPRVFQRLLPAAIERRRTLLADPSIEAVRLFAAEGDGLPGVYLDRLGPAAILILHADEEPGAAAADLAGAALEQTAPLGVRAIYLKPFTRDRSKLGGAHPAVLTDPTPAAGEPQPESFLVREYGWKLEIRPFDGFSTGIFPDQRDNRRHLAGLLRDRASSGKPARVLNTFCYTGAFSIACALAHPSVEVSSVDVSPKYLEWAKRNFTHNGLDASQPRYRFARMDTFEFLAYARRKQLLYDLIILDPPSFSAGNKRRGVETWSSTADYPRLIAEAAPLLDPNGARLLFASTNTTELCLPGRFERMIEKGLGKRPQWEKLQPPAPDFALEPGRLEARLFRC